MVRHRWRLRGANWRRNVLVNGSGAIATAVVLSVIVASKFIHGAWMIVLLIPVLVAIFIFIERHYRGAADQLVLTGDELHTNPALDPAQISHTILIPAGDINRPALQAIAYARSLTGQVGAASQDEHAHIVAVHVTDDVAAGEALKERWARTNVGVPLVVVESPYRSPVVPLLTYINALEQQQTGGTSMVTVLLPEFIPAHWWEYVLHTQTALRLKGALLFRPRTAVISVPYHLHS